MHNQTNRKCPTCGFTLQQISDNTAVCPHCFNEFPIRNDAFSRSRQNTINQEKIAKLKAYRPCMIPCIIILFAIGAFPLAIMLIVIMLSLDKDTASNSVAQKQPQNNLSSSKTPKTRADYLCAFEALPRVTMPLGIYGDRAIQQIKRLEQKQQALSIMLGKEHPFIHNGNEAEAYILKNCKHMLYRLQFCDQSNPEFCRTHAEYLEQKLSENEKVLRDFEKLVIEVTQLDLDAQDTTPCLDVLAETLRNVRTLDGTLPEYSRPDRTATQRLMQG